MTKKKISNQGPLSCFVTCIGIIIYGIFSIAPKIGKFSNTELVIIILFGTLFTGWMLTSFMTLRKNGFFHFLKLKRFQLPFWAVTTLILGVFAYINSQNIGMLIVNIFFLCLSIIFLGRVSWKILEDIGDGIPDNNL